MSFSQPLNPTKMPQTQPMSFRLHDWEDLKVHLIFSAGYFSPKLFDLLLRWIGRHKEEPQICLLFWPATFNTPLFHLILAVRRFLLSHLHLIR